MKKHKSLVVSLPTKEGTKTLPVNTQKQIDRAIAAMKAQDRSHLDVMLVDCRADRVSRTSMLLCSHDNVTVIEHSQEKKVGPGLYTIDGKY